MLSEHRVFSLFALLHTSLLFVPQSGLAQSTSNHNDIVGRILAQRQLIVSGHVICRVQLSERNVQTGELRVKSVSKIESWLDGSKLRTDGWHYVNPKTLAKTPRTRRTIVVARGEIRYGYFENRSGDGELHIVDQGDLYPLFQPENVGEYGFPRSELTIVDRVRPKDASIQVTRDESSPGSGLVVVTCDFTKENRHHRIFSDPKKNFAIVRYESNGTDAEGAPWKSEFDLTYTRLEDGTFFPSVANWKDWSANGTSLVLATEVRRETLSATINKAIDPTVFTISGLDLPPGTDVIDGIHSKNLGPAGNIRKPLPSEIDKPTDSQQALNARTSQPALASGPAARSAHN